MAIEPRRYDRTLVIRTGPRLDSVTAQAFHDRLGRRPRLGRAGRGQWHGGVHLHQQRRPEGDAADHPEDAGARRH